MKKNLFGSLGETIKGNAVLIILSVCVLVAGGLSYYTVSDINNKLKNQHLKGQSQTATPAPEQEDAQDVQNEAKNVPLKPSPAPTKKPPEASPSPSADPSSEISEENAAPSSGFLLPTEGEIYNAFSRDELVYNQSMDDWRTHNGIDIKASKDTAVRAAVSGNVTAVYQDGMLGNVVEIKTEDYIVKYCGLNSNIMVKKGDAVSQGKTIGTIGEISLEIADDSHLHLEILKNGKQVDPAEYLK